MKLLLPISIICIITMTIYTAGYIYILIYEETLKVYLKIVAGIVIFSYNCLTVFYLYDHLIKFYLLFSNKSKKDQDELVNDSYGHQLKRSTTNARHIGYQERRSISESRRQLRASMTEKKSDDKETKPTYLPDTMRTKGDHLSSNDGGSIKKSVSGEKELSILSQEESNKDNISDDLKPSKEEIRDFVKQRLSTTLERCCKCQEIIHEDHNFMSETCNQDILHIFHKYCYTKWYNSYAMASDCNICRPSKDISSVAI